MNSAIDYWQKVVQQAQREWIDQTNLVAKQTKKFDRYLAMAICEHLKK